MAPSAARSSDVVLARLNHELEKISAAQHRLARRKALLREQISRLRLGASVAEVRLALKAIAAEDHEERRRWPVDSAGLPLLDRLPDPRGRR